MLSNAISSIVTESLKEKNASRAKFKHAPLLDAYMLGLNLYRKQKNIHRQEQIQPALSHAVAQRAAQQHNFQR